MPVTVVVWVPSCAPDEQSWWWVDPAGLTHEVDTWGIREPRLIELVAASVQAAMHLEGAS